MALHGRREDRAPAMKNNRPRKRLEAAVSGSDKAKAAEEACPRREAALEQTRQEIVHVGKRLKAATRVRDKSEEQKPFLEKAKRRFKEAEEVFPL